MFNIPESTIELSERLLQTSFFLIFLPETILESSVTLIGTSHGTPYSCEIKMPYEGQDGMCYQGTEKKEEI